MPFPHLIMLYTADTSEIEDQLHSEDLFNLSLRCFCNLFEEMMPLICIELQYYILPSYNLAMQWDVNHTTYRKNNNLEKCAGKDLNGFHIK